MTLKKKNGVFGCEIQGQASTHKGSSTIAMSGCQLQDCLSAQAFDMSTSVVPRNQNQKHNVKID